MRTRLEALRRKLRSASPEVQRSAEYAKEEAEFYALKERVQTMVTRRIAARAAEPADHVVTVHLTKSQYAKLEKVARYDGHRFIEETTFSAIRCHCIAFLAAVHHMPEWEAEARFDGGQRPTEATRHQ